MIIIRYLILVLYLIMGILLLTYPVNVHARAFHPTPLPYSCEQVRWAFDTFSKEHLLSLAKKFHINVTATQRRQAQACMRDK